MVIITTAYAVFTNKDYATQLSYFGIVLGIGMVEATIMVHQQAWPWHIACHRVYRGEHLVYISFPSHIHAIAGEGMAMLVASMWLAPIVYAMV